MEQAIKDKNSIEIIDALCDILYVVAGAKVYFNLPVNSKYIDDNFNMVRMSKPEPKIQEIDLKYIIERLDDKKVLNIIDKIKIHKDNLDNITELLINDKKMVYHSKFFKHLIGMYDSSLNKIVKNIFRLEEFFTIDILYQFDIVHASNMTKVCNLEEDAKETVEWYKINETRYVEPSYRKIKYNNREYYVIYDIETNKILKSIKYIPAKFI